jgi:hypothetical protein
VSREERSRLLETLRRLFMGRIAVRPFPVSLGRFPEIRNITRIPAVRGGIPGERVVISQCFRWRNKAVEAPRRIVFSEGASIGAIAFSPLKTDVRIVSLAGLSVTPRNGRTLINGLPHYRTNQLGFFREKPLFEGASVLALFTPIIKDGVVRSALDKGSGRLCVWMDPRTNAERPFHLLLVRRLSGPPSISWVWLPVSRRESPGGGSSIS